MDEDDLDEATFYTQRAKLWDQIRSAGDEKNFKNSDLEILLWVILIMDDDFMEVIKRLDLRRMSERFKRAPIPAFIQENTDFEELRQKRKTKKSPDERA